MPLKELPALVKLPLAEIESLIDRKIAPRATEAGFSPSTRRERRWRRGTTTRCSGQRTSRSSKAASWRCWKGRRPWPGSVKSPLAGMERAASPRSSGPWRWPTPTRRRSGSAWTDAAVSAASVLHDLARYAEAEPLLRDCQRASRIQQRAGLPGSRRGPQQPGAVAPGHEPAGGGRAADAPGAGDRRASLRPRPPQRRHPPQQPGAVAPGHEPAGGGRAAVCAGRWPSTSRSTAPTTPTSPATSTTWRSCSRPRTGWRRPSR